MLIVALPFTWAQQLAWKDDATLQANMFRVRPDDPQSQLAEGVRRGQAGDVDGSYPLCTAYAERYPDSDRADYCIGNWLFQHGQPRAAADRFERFLRRRPHDHITRRALLAALFAVGDLPRVRVVVDDWKKTSGDTPEVLAAERELGKIDEGRRP